MFKINPKQIQDTMKRMGISQEPLDVKRVIFEMQDKNLVIDEPSVSKVQMQGQDTYQVNGETREESKEGFSEDDIKMVIEKTNKSEKQVREFLEQNNGDIALAIIELGKN
jgi:nascent polypeptide-associated complex subunit alpha